MNRNAVLYISLSLDGYIADHKGSVDWISGQNENEETEDTFTPFFKGVDTVIMGRNTYNQIVNELSPEQWPYEGATTYVLSHRNTPDDYSANIRFRNMNVCKLVEELKQESGKDIWICGGAEVAQQLIANNLIDTYHLAVIPVILGKGIRLFGTNELKIELQLTDTNKYNGIMEMVYRRR